MLISLRFYHIEIKTFLILQREIVPAVKIFQIDNSSQLRQNAFFSLFFKTILKNEENKKCSSEKTVRKKCGPQKPEMTFDLPKPTQKAKKTKISNIL